MTTPCAATAQITRAEQVLAALRGRWTFVRTITGFPEMEGKAEFRGAQDLLPSIIAPSSIASNNERTHGLYYREELLFPAPNGSLLPAHREYLYRCALDGEAMPNRGAVPDGEAIPDREAIPNREAIEVLFVRNREVGERFLLLPLPSEPLDPLIASTVLAGEHLCRADLYQAKLDLDLSQSPPASFSITYRISGPRKNHVHETRYTRHVS